MKEFLADDFLLDNKTAKELYFQVARELPVVDWHCHIPPRDIAENRQFENIAQIWLEGDHYKWRAMRQNGIDEAYITGDAPAREKYKAWAATVPQCIGNPLYHWTHLELARGFGITRPLGEKTADGIWEEANRIVASPAFRAKQILEKFRVKVLFTTDDPADSLEYHRRIRLDTAFGTKVFPAFRPDASLHIALPGFAAYMERLGAAAGVRIERLDDLKQALHNRMDFFAELGCRTSDQSLGKAPFRPEKPEKADAIFRSALHGVQPAPEQEETYQTALMQFLAREYSAHGWAMELHLGALRNCNARMFRAAGPDTGFDAMGDAGLAEKLSRLLNSVAAEGRLPRTILFSINPKDNATLAALAGSFAEKTQGRVQPGPAWWFNDNRDGMEAQMKTFANLGVFAGFIGMATDSRSLLSYPRHEYFRRILCNLIGTWVENGEYPRDPDALGNIVRRICYGNAVRYFHLEDSE